jgi:mannosyltransferase OCH1-like enzyme
MSTKKIWMYWHQGWDDAPLLVKQSQDSWCRLNPDYQVHTLDWHSLPGYIDLPERINLRRKDLTVQKIAAFARLALLSKYGGVWTDATVICARPLHTWLAAYHTDGFFAFRNPTRDRLMSNWFIAAEPGSILLQRLHERFVDFYVRNTFTNQNTALGNVLLRYFHQHWSLDLAQTPNWLSWFARKVLRVYPYFIFHYTFNKLILDDPECRALWEQARPFPAQPSHRLLGFAKLEDGLEKARTEIDAGLTPMYKLNWRLIDRSPAYWTAVMRLLEERR